MRLRRYRPLALVLLALQLQACGSWQPTTLSPPQLIEEEEPSRVRITRTDGEQVIIQSPEVRADSIVGHYNLRSEFGSEDMSVAVSDVRQIETLRFSPGRTVGVLFLTAAFGFWVRNVPARQFPRD